ncbi:MAG: glycogen-binding domain-containing protein [Elusimicrobiaceae bacterium]|nr:glycogen-binding domain-containing protein [Elusimicrobiaceae bacterium]
MENENLDLDVKPANKDLWLFLIIVDLVFLCVLGVFLYRHFAPRFLRMPPVVVESSFQPEVVQPQEDVVAAQPETVLQEIVITEEKQEQKPEETVVAEILATSVAPEPVAQPQEKKQSVIVVKNPKSKYRKVTFRWFGAGKKVAVVSGFTMAKPQALKKKDGYWETTLSIAPGTYKFLFVVDGENTLDPYSPEKDGRSVVTIE